jgi:DNA polymerase III subunit epsilon
MKSSGMEIRAESGRGVEDSCTTQKPKILACLEGKASSHELPRTSSRTNLIFSFVGNPQSIGDEHHIQIARPPISWQGLDRNDMPLLIIGVIAVFAFMIIKQLSSAASTLDSSSDQPISERPSTENAEMRGPTDRIDLNRIELDPSKLPSTFVVFDLETTGLDPARDEIIEIGAVRFSPATEVYDTFRVLVQPTKRIPRMITRINGISQDMVNREGIPLGAAVKQFGDFIRDFPLVSFNAAFDMAFLQNAAKLQHLTINNSSSCALKMARLAWPNRESYKLSDLAENAGLSQDGTHHALLDCKRALIVYIAAVSLLDATEEHSSELQFISPRMQAFRQTSRIPDNSVERNLLGMELEASGLIEPAIECYQANVRDGFDGNHPYDRLAIIFRKRKDNQSEIAVLTRAIEVFSQLQTSRRSDVVPKLKRFRERLCRISSDSTNVA